MQRGTTAAGGGKARPDRPARPPGRDPDRQPPGPARWVLNLQRAAGKPPPPGIGDVPVPAGGGDAGG